MQPGNPTLPPGLTPEMIKKMQQGGMPMNLTPEMLQKMQQGMMQAQGQKPPQSPEHARAEARKKANPLPPGRGALQTLRALSECPITSEAGQLKGLLDKMLDLQLQDIEEPMKTVGEGIASVIMADTYCAKQRTKRPVVRFEDDELLSKTHSELKEQADRQLKLQQELMETNQQVQKLLKARWDTAVKKFGLAPERFSYEIDEDDGIIHLVDLKCNECKGRAISRKARQEVAAKLVTFEKASKESENNGEENNSSPGEPQGSGENGEASIQK